MICILFCFTYIIGDRPRLFKKKIQLRKIIQYYIIYNFLKDIYEEHYKLKFLHESQTMTSTDFKILQKQNYNNGKMQYVIQIVCGRVDFQILYHSKPIKEI